METISRHAVKYRTEKYFKNKLIKPTLISERKVNLNAAPQRASNVKLYFNFPFNYHKEDDVAAAELNLFLYNI